MKHRMHVLSAVACGTLLLAYAPAPVQAQLGREVGIFPPAAAGEAEPLLPTGAAFALDQLRYPRVRSARLASRFGIKRLFHEGGLTYPAAELYLRIFKRERSLEVWVRQEGAQTFELLKTYGICALAGELGPKHRQGDSQVPEGFYAIDFFNPNSDFHLSLHIDYPNQRDRTRPDAGDDLGGDIFIHGGCNSEGCIALTDEGIRELYWLGVEARALGQRRIPVHIFPARLDERDMENLERTFGDTPGLVRFWHSLQPGYAFFEEHRRLPAVTVDARGDYRINGAAPPGWAGGEPAAGEQHAGDEENRPKKPLGSPIGGG